jgi:tRNA-uridine 2-sulfurtransferase
MTHRAVALLSGGLDSTLAVQLMLDQGVDVHALNASTPFCTCNRGGGCESERVAEEFSIPLRRVMLTDEFLTVLRNPKHGYGSGMNPCLDCRMLLFAKGKEYMQEIGASFVFTGEVLGQRPMSQHLRAMQLIDAETGLEGRVLRPLSARLLPPTLPEKEGVVQRDKLLSMQGRTRKPQMRLAADKGIHDYPCPAGGCRLTDPGFARRMRDLRAHKPDFDLGDIELLKLGRHFRLSSSAKVVVGRQESENALLRGLINPADILLETRDYVGALALLRGESADLDVANAAAIVARYSDTPGGEVAVSYAAADATAISAVWVTPLGEQELADLRI